MARIEHQPVPLSGESDPNVRYVRCVRSGCCECCGRSRCVRCGRRCCGLTAHFDKFGPDYRTYERGTSVGKGHSKVLVHVVPEEYSCSLPELARAVRLATTVNKTMVYAVVDEEGDVTYYSVGRFKP